MENKLVLILDSDEHFQRSMRQGLRKAGYSVKSCSTAEEALKFIRFAGSGVDIFVTEMTTDGLLFASKLKRKAPNAKSILTTGFPQLREYFLNSNILVKPFPASDLVAVITRELFQVVRSNSVVRPISKAR
jgi:DNA-binding NtrC family response regulator